MTEIDYGIIIIILVSLLLGLSRGFIKEANALLVWVIAIGIGLSFDHKVAYLLSPVIKSSSIRIAVAFCVLLLVILALGNVILYFLNKLIEKTGLTDVDRLAGMLLGIIHGMAVVSILVMLIEPTPFSKQAMWQKSGLVPSFHLLLLWLKEQIHSL